MVYLCQNMSTTSDCIENDELQRRLTSAFVDAHVPCYLDGPTSFCDIPLLDVIRVINKALPTLVTE